MTGFAPVAFSGKAHGSLIKRTAWSSARDSPARLHEPARYFHERPVGDVRRPTTPAARPSPTSGRTAPLTPAVDAAAAASSQLERPYDPGLTSATSRSTRSRPRLGHRSRHLARERPAAGTRIAAVRHLPLATSSADPAEHRRPQPRLLRRARRQRPRAQPRTRPREAPPMTSSDVRGRSSRATSSGARERLARKLDPRVQIRNPVMFVVELGA